MAHSVEDRSNSLSDALIDWSAETEPELLWSKPTISHKASNASASPKVFVLTGSTGFLGQYLLHRLAEDPQVEKIHCVAVRDSQNRQSLFDFEKAVVHPGDLALPPLGLSEETATAIFAEADVVIHNGANVSHLKSYQTLRPANVNSTKELVRLGLDRTIPIHYVVNSRNRHVHPQESFGEVSVGSTLPPNNGSDGYTSSKWASERYLERVNEHHGLPIWIHRPSSITRSSSLLGEDASEMELLQNLLKYSRVIKATPSSPRLKGALDLVTAETVADGIVKSALENQVQPTVTYVHQTGDFCLPITDMKAFLETETNSTLETVSPGEWADRAVAAGLHPTVGAAFRKVEEMHEGAMVFPAFVKGETVVK